MPAWNRIMREAFGMTDPDLGPLLASCIDDPAAVVLGAWDRDLLVGAGAVHLLGEVAALNTGATLASHRGRGIQAALIAARAALAEAAGCRLLSAETGSREGDPSYRNLLRAGFAPCYDRTSWQWVARVPSS